MRDYWLSKLMFDLQQPAAAEEYRAQRDAVLARYKMKPEVLKALLEDDVVAMSRLVNPYLLRFYYVATGKPESWFLERIRKAAPQAEVAHG